MSVIQALTQRWQKVVSEKTSAFLISKFSDEQFSEIVFQSGSVGKSYWNIEWWNQHGCGVKEDVHDINHIDCQVILQYKCHDVNDDNKFRNGFITSAPKYNGRGNIDKETWVQVELKIMFNTIQFRGESWA